MLPSCRIPKQPQLKAATQSPEASSSPEETVSDLPWYTGQSKSQEEKSQQYHQERVERYHTIQNLASKEVDVTSIAQQMGLSRQSFAQGLRKDYDAVKAGLTLQWSQGPVEGHSTA